MFADPDRTAVDPRTTLDPASLEAAAFQAAPRVARAGQGGDILGLAAAGVGALALGAFTLMGLSNDRTAHAKADLPDEAAAASAPAAPVARPTTTMTAVPASAPTSQAPATPAPNVVVEDPNQSRANPMIVDNSLPDADAVGRPAAGSGATSAPQSGTPDELFASRLGAQGRIARAERIGNPAFTVVQGTLIPAVLETALNSDLPGYARAIVSRDVRGFDGSRVLIPRGSRLIGEYKSGLATGQTRAHVVWTRLVRPDGVSIDLGSPATDETGQAGLSGRVDRHYSQRYGPAALLSLISGVAGSIGGGSSSTVVVGSTASGAASQALQTDGQIPPTVRLPQGAPIQVFTARDLDFSAG
jgi:type IV secretion system protein VirB10